MKIALIELGGSHDECLYSHIKIIKSTADTDLTLICSESLKENVKLYDSVDNKWFVSLRSGLKQWIDIYRLWRRCKKEQFDKIVLNTAQGKTISRFLRFPFGAKTKFYGILHDTKKIGSSHSQKIISRKVKRYFILNEYLAQNIKNEHKHDLKFAVFYPIFFPTYPQIPVDKKDDELWVCIPGQVELKRRDYKSLFDSIATHGIKKNVKILLLGKYGHAHGDGEYVLGKINDLSVSDHFLVWKTFIPVDTFHVMVQHSDFILPLIHEESDSGNLYKTQISGAYNLAVAYRKPLLMEKHVIDTLADYECIAYQKDDIMKTINSLEKSTPAELYTHEKWSFDFQKANYLAFLDIS